MLDLEKCPYCKGVGLPVIERGGILLDTHGDTIKAKLPTIWVVGEYRDANYCAYCGKSAEELNRQYDT